MTTGQTAGEDGSPRAMPARKTIEIRGIGFPNRGAELMLICVATELRRRLGGSVRLVCRPSEGRADGVELMCQLGVLPKLEWIWRRWSIARIGAWVPFRIRRTFGIVTEGEVDAVLDASGLCYSDQWGSHVADINAAYYRRLAKRGRPVILLPQAFGPFSSPRLIRGMRIVVDASELVFVRDHVSEEALVGCVGPQAKIRRAPDFTCGCDAGFCRPPGDPTAPVLIIPNCRMFDRTGLTREQYLRFLQRIGEQVKRLSLLPRLLVHEGEGDRELATDLSRLLGLPDGEVLDPRDAMQIKRVIGRAVFVVSSRYHGAVSALVQGVPALVTSWSHKYETLLADFGVADGVLRPDADDDRIRRAIEAVAGGESRAALLHSIRETRSRYFEETRRMWDTVFSVLARHGIRPAADSFEGVGEVRTRPARDE